MCDRMFVFFMVVTAVPKSTSGPWPAPKQEAIKVEDEVYILLHLIVKCHNYEGSINFIIYQINDKYFYYDHDYYKRIRYLLIIGKCHVDVTLCMI